MLRPLLLGLAVLWTLSEAAAVPKGAPCPTLKLKFGRIRYRQKGRFVKFMCNTGYIIAGEKYSTCHNGVWDSPLPKCVRASCQKVNPPINGLIYTSHRGAVLNFFCKPGFELRGPNATYCDGRKWDSNLPACIASNTKPALSCDFESEDLCGWNHDLRHDFDWKRLNHRTPSGYLGTGPSFDHTKGEGKDGHYMYIESSSRNENDTARLISPIYDPMNESDVCLEFYYHMHGVSTGQLRVYLKKESDSWDLDPQNALFWKSGNHGDKWLHSLLQIGPIQEDFQIIIEGVRGASYFSDIAVDDVRIMENCAFEDDITTESDITYPDNYQSIESCQNRCDNDNFVIPPTEAEPSNCGCDITCLDNDTCCPDYIVVCLFEDSTTAMDVTTTVETTITEEVTTRRSPTIRTTTPTTAAPVKKKIEITANSINSVLPKNINQPKKYLPIRNNTNFNRIPQPYVPPIRSNRTLIFLTPEPTQAIVQKVKPRTLSAIKAATASTKVNVKITKSTPTPKTTLTTTLTTKTKIPTYIDEVATVPQPTEEDHTYFNFVPVTTRLKIVAPNSTSDSTFGNLLANSKIQNQKIVVEKSNKSIKFVMITVSIVVFILFIVLSTVFVVRRYRTRRLLNSSSSDSQSDVRFLTHDEILDFNLAYPDN